MKNYTIVLGLLSLIMTSCFKSNNIVVESLVDGKINVIVEHLKVTKVGDTIVTESIINDNRKKTYFYGMHRGDIPVDYTDDTVIFIYEAVVRIK
jgi:hypothetical protein